MHVNLILFGILRDLLPPQNRGRATLPLPDGTTVVDLISQLKVQRRVIVAVNDEEITDHTQVLIDGDEVAMFTPIGGGRVGLPGSPPSISRS